MKQVRRLDNRQTVQQAMERTGTTSPSAALHALKKTNSKFTYLPHVGSKQRMKARHRAQLTMLNKLTEIHTPEGVRRGFTGVQQLSDPDINAFVKHYPELFATAPNMDAVVIIE